MIIKKMDSKQEEIPELMALLKGKPTPYQRFSTVFPIGERSLLYPWTDMGRATAWATNTNAFISLTF
jgi:hypothetical protein